MALFKKTPKVHDVHNENGLRITSEGNVFVQGDAGEIALTLKKAELGRVSFEGFSIGSGEFAKALLGDQYSRFSGQLTVQDFALDLSSRAVVAEYYGNPQSYSKWGSAFFPRFSPAAKETLKQKHQLRVDYRLTLEDFSPHDENQAVCFFGGESNDGYAKDYFWLGLDKSSQKKDVLLLRLNMAPEMLAEQAFSAGVNLHNLDLWIPEGSTPDNYSDSITGKSAAPRTDGGECAFLQIDTRSGEATLLVEDKNQRIVQQSNTSLGVADADFIQRIQSRLSQAKQTSHQAPTSNTKERSAAEASSPTTKASTSAQKTSFDKSKVNMGAVGTAIGGLLALLYGIFGRTKPEPAKEGDQEKPADNFVPNVAAFLGVGSLIGATVWAYLAYQSKQPVTAGVLTRP